MLPHGLGAVEEKLQHNRSAGRSKGCAWGHGSRCGEAEELLSLLSFLSTSQNKHKYKDALNSKM